LGLVAGIFLGRFVLPQEQRRWSSRTGLLGTCAGILVSAFRHGQTHATAGVVSGAITGLIVFAGLVLLLIGTRYLLPRAPIRYDETDEVEKVGEEDEDHGGGLRLRRF
jgi:hypothetical protein